MEEQQIAASISKLISARDTIQEKLLEFGTVAAGAKLEDCAKAIAEMENQGALTHELQAGERFSIPKGYHNGLGVVSAKTDSGSGSGSPSLPPLDTPASANDVASGKEAYLPDGTKLTGTLPDSRNAFYLAFRDAGINHFPPQDGQRGSLRFDVTTGNDNGAILKRAGVFAGYEDIAAAIDLSPEDIRQGASILGVTGTYEGTGGGSETERPDLSPLSSPASNIDIAYGKEAYDSDGAVITGAVVDKRAEDHHFTVIDKYAKGSVMTDGSQTDSTLNLTVSCGGHGMLLDTLTVCARYSKIAEAIGLKPEMIAKGSTVLGIEGTYEGGVALAPLTSPASANDLAKGKEAYLADASKITGNLDDCRDREVAFIEVDEYEQATLHDLDSSSENVVSIHFSCSENGNPNGIILEKINVLARFSKIASAIGLTPEMIAKGSTVLGIEGTYAGLDPSDATARASDVLSGLTFYSSSGTKETGTLKLGNTSLTSDIELVDRLDGSYTPPDMEEWPIVRVFKESTKDDRGIFRINAGTMQADTYYYGKATARDDQLEHTYILYSPREYTIKESSENSGVSLVYIGNTLLQD